CVPEDTSLTLPMKIVEQPQPQSPAMLASFAAARAKLPVASPWPMHYRLRDRLKFFVAAPALAHAKPVSADFFPLTSHELRMSAAQSFAVTRDGLFMDLVPSKRFKVGQVLTGVLVLASRDGSVQALDVSAHEGFVPETDFMSDLGMTVPLSLLFAFLGGIILNLMP